MIAHFALLLVGTDALRAPLRPHASIAALRLPPRRIASLLRAEETAAPEIEADIATIKAHLRAKAARRLSVAAIVASAVQNPAAGVAAKLVAGAGIVAAVPLAATSFATLADGDATRPLRAALAAAHASAVYAACRTAGGLTSGLLVAPHAYALLVAAWPFDAPAAAWRESTRALDRQWAGLALALACGASYWLCVCWTPLVLLPAPWAGVGAAAAAQKARAPSKSLAAGLYASGAVAFLASAVAAATTGARGLAPFATLATFALVCVKA